MEELSHLVSDHLDTDGHIIREIEGTVYYSTDWGWVKEPMGYAHNVTNGEATPQVIEDYVRDTPSRVLQSVPVCS
jgi:hypothetical protein